MEDTYRTLQWRGYEALYRNDILLYSAGLSENERRLFFLGINLDNLISKVIFWSKRSYFHDYLTEQQCKLISQRESDDNGFPLDITGIFKAISYIIVEGDESFAVYKDYIYVDELEYGMLKDKFGGKAEWIKEVTGDIVTKDMVKLYRQDAIGKYLAKADEAGELKGLWHSFPNSLKGIDND